MKKLLFTLIIYGCSLGRLENNMEVHQNTSLIVKYFLQDLPTWANYSQAAKCHRMFNSKYVDLKKLAQDSSFDYFHLVQFQYLYNIEYNKLLHSIGGDSPSSKEEEKLFYDVLAKVRGGILPFYSPKFQRVHLIWLDPYLRRKKDFQKLIDSNALILGHPVFISLCLSNREIMDLINKYELQNKDIRILSYEALNFFDTTLNLQNFMKFDFNILFESGQKLYLYNPDDLTPNEFFGIFEKIK